MSVIKGIAQAVQEVVQMGGRVTDETAKFLDKLLSDDLDEFQEDAREFVNAAEKFAESKLAEIEEKLEELLGRVEDIEPAKTATAAKKVTK